MIARTAIALSLLLPACDGLPCYELSAPASSGLWCQDRRQRQEVLQAGGTPETTVVICRCPKVKQP